MKAILYTFSFAFLFTVFPSQALGQTTCGDFVKQEIFEGELYIEREPIDNCDNPFKADEPVPFSPTFAINGEEISLNETVSIASGTPVIISGTVPLVEGYSSTYVYLYEKRGVDYLIVAESRSLDKSILLKEGEYVAVFSRSLKPELSSESSWFNQFLEFFLPTTAYASNYIAEYDEVVVVPFSITYLQPEPAGASSILFLPGIMGSHLYEESGECLGFGEQQRWFSHTDCEQLRLLTNPDGSSINDIYTKFEDGAVVDKASKFGVTLEELYTNFIEQMNELEESQTIKDFTPFAYDWRLRLDQIIRAKKESDSNKVRYIEGTSLQDGLLYKTVSEMANRSHSGRVTIVSHSNGGLVAKAFLAELEESNDPLEGKIDNLILIGSPQVGTPDAVKGILHGNEIGPGGLIVTQETARKLLNTAPFGHHLLPNQHYFEGEGVSVQTPVITFKEGLATNLWRIQYGDSIDSFEELKRFLDDSSGRVKPAANDLNTPEVVDGTLLTYAEEVADKLANWEPSDSLTVYQLGGSGIWTPSRLEYSTLQRCIRTIPVGFTCDGYSGFLMNEVHGVYDGDGTVVLPSALAEKETKNIERFWLDLSDFNNDFGRKNVHKNMLEVPEVAMFVSDIVHTRVGDYSYIVDTPPPVPKDIRLMFHLHSPLDMYVTSDQGTVSSTTNEISGAFYRRFGEVQYISLPNTVTNATLHLIGYDNGSYTLFKELWQGDTELSSVDFKALPTNVGTVVTLPIDFTQAGVMQVDFDGDGDTDGTVSESEDVIEAVTPYVNEEEKQTKGGSSGTRVKNLEPKVAGASTVSKEEQLEQIIELLKRIIALLRIKNNL